MTIQGAIAELQNLLDVDDVPFYYKGGIQKVIETIQMELIEQTEPQTNADQHFQGVESVEAKRCEKCKHFKGYWEFPSPKRDGTFERFVECGIKECDHEPKDESQTEVLAQIHELYAEMEKLLRKSSAEIVGAIREQMEKEKSNE